MNYFLFSVVLILQLCLLNAGCSPSYYHNQTDQTAYAIIKHKQQEALGFTEGFSIETPEETLRRTLLFDQHLPYAAPSSIGSDSLADIDHWPEKRLPFALPEQTAGASDAPDMPVTISLVEALQIGAENSREYQTRKEDLFRKALNLDFERNDFRNTLAGQMSGLYSLDRTNAVNDNGVLSGAEGSASLSLSRTLLTGANFTTRIGLDLVQMLRPDRFFSRSIFGDASITIPLLRGSGRHIVTEPLTQAEREMLYAVWDFEFYKADFTAGLIDKYLTVLKAEDQVLNQEENYRGLIRASSRANRLSEAGKTPRIQVDQAIQNELRARDRWIAVRQAFGRELDQFKIRLGLPTDAYLQLDRKELNELKEYINNRLGSLFTDYQAAPAVSPQSLIVLAPPPDEERGPLESDQAEAIRLALAQRLDLKISQGRVYDAQRKVMVAADQLRPELSLFGSVNAGERRGFTDASLADNGRLDFSNGLYTGLLTLDLPLERTAEALAYRDSYIALERAVRDIQEREDTIKQQIRNNLRNLEQSRASLKIQRQAVQLAERRVHGASLNLEAGRAEIRDLLEAQEALLNAQNGLTSAMIDYRLAEVFMQRDMGILRVDNKGVRHEQIPGVNSDATNR